MADPKDPERSGNRDKQDVSQPGMMGDGTEEQNLNQPGNPSARIRQDEVEEAFGEKGQNESGPGAQNKG